MMSSTHVCQLSTSSVECWVPNHTHANVSGTKISVDSHSGGFAKRSTRPITTASPRYSTPESATAPPWLKRNVSPAASASPVTNVPAVTSTNATMTYTSASQMNERIASHALGPSACFTTSAIERASWRTEATSVTKSWTAPMKTAPNVIQ